MQNLQGQGQLPGNITVNPIIKIVNGDDKSSGPIDSGANTTPTTHPQLNNTPVIITGSESTPKKSSNSESSNFSEDDFSKPLIIKKI
jgi:hypothetical protein